MIRACVAASLVVLALTPAQQVSKHVVYTIVTDDKGVPVADLTPADFVVKEDGKTRDVVSAAVATNPMKIAVIVDDNGTGIFRYGLSDFAQRLRERAELSLRVVTGQVRKVLDYTTSFQAWMIGINQVGVRPPTPEGGQLLEGISETARELKTGEAPRAVILVLTVGGEEHSTLLARHVLDQLHQSGAALHVIFAGNAAVRSPSAAAKPAELLGSNMNLSQVLGDGPKQSGGRRRDVIATQALLGDLQQVARELTSQYAVTYIRPEAGRPPQKIQVSVQRRGVGVVAPTRAPIR